MMHNHIESRIPRGVQIILVFLLFPASFFLFFPALHAGVEKNLSSLELAEKAFWNLNYRKADSIYTAELARSPGNAELYWKKARTEVSIAESDDYDKKEARIRDYRLAEEHARKSISLDSTSSKGHAWLAASLGIMADKIGSKEKLKRANEVKRELDIALRLNPNDETALSILGSYYKEAANIGWLQRFLGNTFVGKMPEGNILLSEKAFRKAILADPRIIRNYHELGLLLLENDRKAEAVPLLKMALDKPVLFASDRRRLEEIRQLLKTTSDE
jgi:tetratricopeptide (TPR) repeat protein